jgi:Protein of unknown function (DUF3618)
MNGAANAPTSPRRPAEIERDLVATRHALGQTLDELAQRLLPRPAQRLVDTGIDVAAGSIGEASVNRCLEFVRANPIPAALIAGGVILALIGRADDTAGAAATSCRSGTRPAAGADTPAASAIRAEGRPKGVLHAHPRLLAAIGLSLGAVVAILLATARDKASASATEDAPHAGAPHQHDAPAFAGNGQ